MTQAKYSGLGTRQVLNHDFGLDGKSDKLEVYFQERLSSGGERGGFYQKFTVFQVNNIHLTQALQTWSVEHYHH